MASLICGTLALDYFRPFKIEVTNTLMSRNGSWSIISFMDKILYRVTMCRVTLNNLMWWLCFGWLDVYHDS